MLSREAKRFIRLKANIEKGLEDLEMLRREKNKIGIEGTHPRILGSILHDFYTAIEKIFRKIAEEFDGGIPQGSDWHKELLESMSLDLEGIRSAVINEKLKQELDEYLRFRHVFRNIYGFQLDAERLKQLCRNFDAVSSDFVNALEEFIRFLKTLAHGVDEA
jgi:hypothetical protein